MPEEVSRFHVSNGALDTIPDLSSDVRKVFLRVLTVSLVSGDHLLYEFRILRYEFSS